MEITPTVIRNLQTAFNRTFQGAFEGVTPVSNDLVTIVPSSTRTSTFGWMSQLPRFREWVGDRVAVNLEAFGYQITNKNFELTVTVRRTDIEDDNLGVYTPLVQEQGQQAKMWQDDLFYDLLNNGETAVCFDKQYFFDVDHPIRPNDPNSPVYSNLFAATPLTRDNYRVVRQKMRTFKGADGRSLRVKPTHLYVPPELESAAKDIVQAERLANGASNTDYNTAQIVVLEDAADATSWYLADNSRAIRPLIVQVRKHPSFQSLTADNSDHVVKKNEYLFGVDSRGNGGYSLPFLMVKAKA